MTRGVYPFELTDPDFAWLLQSFKENHPEYLSIESPGLPVSLIRVSVPSQGVSQHITDASRLLAAPTFEGQEKEEDKKDLAGK